MIQDKFQFIASMSMRQKMIAGAVVLVVIFLIWQLMGLFGNGNGASTPPPPTVVPLQQMVPKPAPLPKPAVSQREKELLQQQEQIEAKYIAAINELQMLKLEREIAETNKAIIDAKLGTITAQKNIVDLLAPPPPPQVIQGGYAQGLAGGVVPMTAQQQLPQATTQQPQEANYTVVSISRLKSKWSAVLGYQTNLDHVSIGDVLPADGSTVVSIDRSGVVLQKEGMRKKVSLVPII